MSHTVGVVGPTKTLSPLVIVQRCYRGMLLVPHKQSLAEYSGGWDNSVNAVENITFL